MKILFLVIPVLMFLGCSEEQKSEEKQAQTITQVEKKEVATAPVKVEAVESAPVVETAPAVEATPVEEKKVEEKKAAVIEQVAKKPAVEVKKVETEVVPEAVAVIEKAEIDGATVFTKCAGCHGQHAEKPALGKSQVIKGWSEEQVVSAIHGYKDGTYGGAMKAVMKGQVSNLTEEEVNAVAKYISKL